MTAAAQKAMKQGMHRAIDPPPAGNCVQARMERGSVSKDWVPDPARPNHDVRVHRTWQPDRMHKAGTLSKAQFDVCERYERTVALASGAKMSDSSGGARKAPWEKGTMPEVTILAQTALRRADEVLGKEAAMILRLVVLHSLTISELAAGRKERRDHVQGRLEGAIDRLGEHWGMI